MEGTEKLFLSGSGIPIRRVYTKEDVADVDYNRDIGLPGEAPFTRGIHSDMYRGRLWTIRRYSGFGTPEDCNKLYRQEYEIGQTGFSVAVDNSTQSGIDSDHPMARAEVGVCGVAVDSLPDIKTLFTDLPIDRVSTAIIVLPMSACALTAMYFAMAEERGLELRQLEGSGLNDVTLAIATANHMFQLAPRHLIKVAVDLIEWCTQVAPKWHPVVFDSYNYREQDISAVQEAGLLLATAIGYIEEERQRGRVPLDKFIRRFAFNMGSHNDFFEEIAKFRAVRRMWYKIVREQYGIEDPRCWQLRLHVQSSGCTHTTQEPLNNLMRIAYQTLAAVLGGVQSVHANSYEEGLCLPTEQGMLLSVRTEQIIQDETNIVNTVDPLGGSYYVERLTSELEERTWEYMQGIDNQGGIVAALESGWVHNEFKRAFLERQSKIVSGEVTVVGVNKFNLPEEPYKIPIFRSNPNATEIQVDKLNKLKKERDNDAVARALKEVKESTLSGENVMPAVLQAVKAYATLGEICDIWREVYGVWRIPMSP